MGLMDGGRSAKEPRVQANAKPEPIRQCGNQVDNQLSLLGFRKLRVSARMLTCRGVFAGPLGEQCHWMNGLPMRSSRF